MKAVSIAVAEKKLYVLYDNGEIYERYWVKNEDTGKFEAKWSKVEQQDSVPF